VFGVGLEHFFLEPAERPLISVVRKADRLRLPNLPNKQPLTYFFESLDFPVTDRKIETFYAEFPTASQPSEPHKHAGVEFIYVVKGLLAVDVEGQTVELNEGDAIYFDSSVLHRYRRLGRSICTALVVVAPP
jgi:mannose-6-phosphate isomerase-like protein (cupin superfamily)